MTMYRVEIFIGSLWFRHAQTGPLWLASLMQSWIEYRQGIPTRIVVEG